MFRVEHRIKINRAVGDVFRFVADSRNDPQWCPPVLDVKQIVGSGPEVGARYSFVAKPGPKQTEGVFEILELKPNEYAAYKGENGMVRFRYGYTFASEGGATMLGMVSEVAPKGFWRLLQPVIRSATTKVTDEEFDKLKRLLEEQSPRAA